MFGLTSEFVADDLYDVLNGRHKTNHAVFGYDTALVSGSAADEPTFGSPRMPETNVGAFFEKV